MCRIDPTGLIQRKARAAIGGSDEMDLSVLQRLRRTALTSPCKDWIPISLTNLAKHRIFGATSSVQGHRMRPNSKPAVGDMRKRITRRCVSAATGACC
jgi:hypothetical protein